MDRTITVRRLGPGASGGCRCFLCDESCAKLALIDRSTEFHGRSVVICDRCLSGVMDGLKVNYDDVVFNGLVIAG